MSRDTVASVTSSNAATLVNWSMLAQISAPSGIMYFCTGNRLLTDGVNTYTPVGGLGGIEPIQEESTLFPRAVKMWLSAVGSMNLAAPMSENMFNQPVRLYRAALSSSMTIVGTPQQCYRGYINKVDVHLGDSQKGNYFELEVESRIKREASSNFYNTETHDQMLSGVYSGDTLFKYVPRIIGYQSKWGGVTQTLGGDGGQADRGGNQNRGGHGGTGHGR